MTKNYRNVFICIFAAFFALNFSCFAQENSENHDDSDDIEFLENENSYELDEALQENFYILETSRNHELNPHLTSYTSDSQIISGLYEGVFSYNPVNLEPQAAIAVDYKISRDKKRWKIILRENARFSNGDQITAESVKYSWLVLLAEENAPFASLFDIVKGAKEYRTGNGRADDVGIYVESPTVLSVVLNRPANYFARILCCPAFSVIHRNPDVSSGAYYLEDRSENTYVLKKNPYYWDAENTKLKTITFVQSEMRGNSQNNYSVSPVLTTADENAHAFNQGLADWVSAEVNTEKLLNKRAIMINAQFGTSYFFFKNSRKKPDFYGTKKISPWDYQEFRAAVLEAFPWEVIRAGSFAPCTTFVYPLSGYPTVEGYDYTDENEAKRLMQAARQKYGYSQDEIIPLVFEIPEGALNENHKTAIKEAMEKLGVDFKVKSLPSFQYLSNVAHSDSDVFYYSWIGDFADPLAFLVLFEGDSTLNDSGWQNDDFDALLEQAAGAGDQERFELLAKAETILLDSAMVLPLFRPFTLNVVNTEETGGWISNAIDLHPLKYLFKRMPKTKIPNIVKLED